MKTQEVVAYARRNAPVSWCFQSFFMIVGVFQAYQDFEGLLGVAAGRELGYPIAAGVTVAGFVLLRMRDKREAASA